MATQPPARPWFRLSSMARPPTQPAPETQPPPSNPLPRPPIIRPTFVTSLRPAQPPPPSVSAPPPSVPAPLPPPVSAPSPPPPPPPSVYAPPPPPSPPPAPPSPISNKTSYPNSSTGSPSSTRIPVTSSSMPPSPTTKTLAPNTVSSVPNSPIPKFSDPVSPLQSFPITKSPAAASSPNRSNFSVTRNLAPTSPLPSSPVVKTPATILSPSPNSPAAKFLVSNSVQNSPPQKPKSHNSPSPSNVSATTTARLPTPSPAPSHKFTTQPTAQTPPNSPKINVNAHPPSPLLLPPSMLHSDTETRPSIPIEAEQKSVVMQKTRERPNLNWANGNSPNTIQNPSNHHGKNHEKGSHYKNGSNTEDKNGMRVITIAGENRGAFMELSQAHKKHGHFEGNPYSLHKKNGNESDTSSNEEGKSKMKDNNNPKNKVNAYMNSNVQGINNSILFNSSYNHHDPGVHLSLSRKPNDGYHKDEGQHNNGHHS